jgi:hypothetical protein
MRWMEKVGKEWRPRHGQLTKMGGKGGASEKGWLPPPPPSPSFSTFFSTNILFSSTTTTFVHNGGAMVTWAGRRPATPWCPYKRACHGEPPPSSHKLTSIAKVSESFSKFQVC